MEGNDSSYIATPSFSLFCSQVSVVYSYFAHHDINKFGNPSGQESRVHWHLHPTLPLFLPSGRVVRWFGGWKSCAVPSHSLTIGEHPILIQPEWESSDQPQLRFHTGSYNRWNLIWCLLVEWGWVTKKRIGKKRGFPLHPFVIDFFPCVFYYLYPPS